MRSAGNLRPQWGYVAPEPGLMHRARIALVAIVIGAIGGAAVVGSLAQWPGSAGNGTPIAAHALLTGAPLATTPAAPTKAVINAVPPGPAIASASKPSAAADDPNGTMMPSGAPMPGSADAAAETPSTAQPTVASANDPADAAPETSATKSKAKRHHLARSDDRRRWGRFRYRRLFDQYGERAWRQDSFGAMRDNW